MMEGEMKTAPANFGVEAGRNEDCEAQDQVASSAHTIGRDSWIQVSVLLVSSFNCGYILTFSNLMLVPLGWAWGSICLLLIGCFTLYANWLLAGFHVVAGRRFIRYRDLMGFAFGPKFYYLTWFLQFSTLILGNMGFILLGGRALKEINMVFTHTPMRLQVFLAITGAAYFIFSVLVPTMSAMKNWLALSSLLAAFFIALTLDIAIKDGKSNLNKDYGVRGSQMDKVFNAFGAVSAILVCNTAGMLPEIQSTIRKPAMPNMRKALYAQYSVGLVIYYGVSIIGYWAYGSSVSEYLPQQFNGPQWAKVAVNATVFLQSVIAQHMFASPIHEALDTCFLKLDEGILSKHNIKRLCLVRMLLFAFNTLVASMLPFMGDFIGLLGSFTLFPLTFVFPSMIFLKVKGHKSGVLEKSWHWANIIFFSILAMVTTIAALRLIGHNANVYHLFAKA